MNYFSHGCSGNVKEYNVESCDENLSGECLRDKIILGEKIYVVPVPKMDIENKRIKLEFIGNILALHNNLEILKDDPTFHSLALKITTKVTPEGRFENICQGLDLKSKILK